MNKRERVIAVLGGKEPDRVPYYGWIFNEGFERKVREKYGNSEAFEDKYEFCLKHIFTGVPLWKQPYDYKNEFLEELPDIELTDPNDLSKYENAKKAVDHFGNEKGRFTYIQTPGAFETYNGIFGIQNHLAYLLMYPDELFKLYDRLADWTISFAMNMIDLGADMIHISDDWGSQKSALFSRDVFEKLIYPYHKKVASAVHKKGGRVSLHSDGNVSEFLDYFGDIGYDVVHPYQESAGMSYDDFAKKYKKDFAILGGIDVQTAIGFGDYTKLESEIRRIMEFAKNEGRLIPCTTHMIQPHCSLEEAEFAFDLIKKLSY